MPEKFEQYNDKELLALFRKSHQQRWLGVLLSRYTLLLLGVCMKYLKDKNEAEDAVQQVFLKTISSIPTTKVENFGGWIYQIAKNECFSRLRERSKNRIVDEEKIKEFVEISNEEPFEKEQKLKRLETALTDLNVSQKECIVLFYLEGKSYQEISERTGYSFKEVKSHIQNGKRNLKNKIDFDVDESLNREE